MGVVCWSRVLVSSPGVGVGVRVCLARQLWALSLGSHRRTVLRKGWGEAEKQRKSYRGTFFAATKPPFAARKEANC